MPTTSTLKNIPDALYDRLVRSAKAHRRTISSEAIECRRAVLLQDVLLSVMPILQDHSAAVWRTGLRSESDRLFANPESRPGMNVPRPSLLPH